MRRRGHWKVSALGSITSLLLLVWASPATGQETWPRPRFKPPLTPSDGLVDFKNTNDFTAEIKLKENWTDVELARLSYLGDEKPVISWQEASTTMDLELKDKPSAVDGLRWSVIVIQAADFEEQESLSPSISLPGGGSTPGYLMVDVVNINDNSPVLSGSSGCEVEEAWEGETACEVVVKDLDGGAKAMEMDVDDGEHFAVKYKEGSANKENTIATYRLHVIKKLNYEEYRLHSLNITATDNGLLENGVVLEGGPLYGSVRLVVTVLDTPDEAPVWGTFVASVSVAEKEAWSVTFEAIDGDFELNWNMKYTLEFPDLESEHQGCFSLDPGTGELTGKPIDRDTVRKEVYRMRVVATEVVPDGFKPPEGFVPESVSGDTVVILADVNDHSPQLGPEDKGGGDGGGRVGTCDAQSTPGDIECQTYFAHAEDVPEESPFSFYFSVHDPDLAENGTFYLELEKSTWSPAFALVPNAGYQKAQIALTALDHSRLDYENPTWREFTLKVIAREQKDPNHVCEANVTISLQNLNDEQPQLNLPDGGVGPIPEHSPTGSSITDGYDITAQDPDGSENLNLLIDWDASTATKMGVRVPLNVYKNVLDPTLDPPDDGEWRVHLKVADKDRFDWEEFDRLNLQLVLEDRDTSPGFEDKGELRAMLEVTLSDINDNAPEFTEQSRKANLSVYENTVGGAPIGVLVAVDEKDGPGNNEVTYSMELLEPLDLPEGLVVIDPDSGQLRTGDVIDVANGPNIDYEQSRSHVYKVTAFDGVMSDSLNITLYVIDVNDETPYLDLEDPDMNLSTTVEEETGKDELVTCIKGLDDDTYEPYRNISYLLNKEIYDTEKYFSIDRWTGCITTKHKSMDREELMRELNTDILSISVYMRDNFQDNMLAGSNLNSATRVQVEVLDINDNRPVFENRTAPFKINERASKDSLVGKVAVTDLDKGENGTVVCVTKPEIVAIGRTEEQLPMLFRLQDTEGGGGCDLVVESSLQGHWGDYLVTLKAHDMGPGNCEGENQYTVTVDGENLHPPNVIKPKEGDKLRLKSGQDISQGKLVDYKDNALEDFQVTDEDDPSMDNFKLSLRVVGDDSAMEQFAIRQLSDGKSFQLMLRAPLTAATQRKYQVTLRASDTEDDDSSQTSERSFEVYVLEAFSQPTFSDRNWTLSFTENATGLQEEQQLPQAIDENNELLPEGERDVTFYHLIDADTDGLFSVDGESGAVTLLQQLDFEQQSEHWLLVAASHSKEPPAQVDPDQAHALNVTVQVEDVNDNPPAFTREEFVGAFSHDATIGTVVADNILAEDPDTVDIGEVRYVRVPGSGTASTGGLSHLAKDGAFTVDTRTGNVTLRDSVGSGSSGLDGYVRFQVMAHDSAGPNDTDHQATAMVKLFVVSSKHQVTFSFDNPFEDVNGRKSQMEVVLGNVLGMACSVERVNPGENSQQAEAFTHFFDNDEPKLSDYVSNMLKDPKISESLYLSLAQVGLSLRGASRVTEDQEEGSYLTTVLGASCAVLAVLVVVFSLAFVVRTRTLSRRLENLTSNRFGSQESGLNREGMAMPGTNQHATEGSNPVWNDEAAAYDNASVSSAGDSDLIGIEDSPEFNGGVAVGGGSGGGGWSRPQRRESVNPLSAGMRLDVEAMAQDGVDLDGAEDSDEAEEADAAPGPASFDHLTGPRRISLNPLAAAGGGSHADGGRGFSNFSFTGDEPTSPTTEL